MLMFFSCYICSAANHKLKENKNIFPIALKWCKSHEEKKKGGLFISDMGLLSPETIIVSHSSYFVSKKDRSFAFNARGDSYEIEKF